MDNQDAFVCKFCGRQCKNNNSLINHERLCKENPNRQISYGNKGNMPKHTKAYYTNKIRTKQGHELDITRSELEQYSIEHQVCEICGRALSECVKWDSKFAPKHFCIDHDYNTNKFRGLLCSVCNRQLGWYEKYKDSIESYLNK